MCVEICEKSKKYIEETFSEYMDGKEITWQNLFKNFEGKIILHVYPTKDTINDDDEQSTGYISSLLFDVHIYDTESMQKYVLKNKDGISFEGFSDIGMQVFKDGSTLFELKGKIHIELFQKLTIRKA